MSLCGCPNSDIRLDEEDNIWMCQNCGVVIEEHELSELQASLASRPDSVVKDDSESQSGEAQIKWQVDPTSTFVHLRVHTHLSFLKATCKPKDLIEKAKEYSMPALAKTEFGNMCGTPTFVRDCHEAGIKPIIGVEFLVRISHALCPITFIALNREGYKQLVKMTTTAWCIRKDKQNGVHLIFDDVPVSKDVVALVDAGLGREIAPLATSWLKNKLSVYIEYNTDSQFIGDTARGLSSHYSCPVVATGNVLYTNEEDKAAYGVALKIGKYVEDINLPDYIDNWFKPPDKFSQLFGFDDEWVQNTVRLSNLVEDYGLINKDFIVPTYKEARKEYRDLTEVHRKLEVESWKGLYDKNKANDQSYIERLQYELEIMRDKKFSSYFLLIGEIIKWMKANGVMVPFGRGCLTGDIKVLTSNRGYVPLKLISTEDKVFTHNGEFKHINKIFKYDIDEEILKISTQYAFENLELTTDHEVYAYKRKFNSYRGLPQNIRKSHTLRHELENAEPEWIEAKRLRIGDYIYTPYPKSRKIVTQPFVYDLSKFIPKGKEHLYKVSTNFIEFYKYKDIINSERSQSRNKGISRITIRRKRKESLKDRTPIVRLNRYMYIDEEFAYFIGRWIGDGWLTNPDTNKKVVGFAFHKNDKIGINKIKRYLDDLGFETRKLNHKKRNAVQLLVCNVLLFNLLKYLFPEYKYTSRTKYIGNLKYRSNGFIKNILVGLEDSDGHIDNQNRENIDTTSKQLMLDVKEALLYLRIPSYVQTRKERIQENGNIHNISYKIRFHGLSTKKSLHATQHITSHGYYSKIKSIKKIRGKKVYDISIQDDKSYLTSVGIVHNSSVGSLVCYALDIITMDPIQWDIPFERFINSGRKDLPDIDTDISQEKRPLVLKHIADVHGQDRVAHIATYQTMALRAAMDNVGRVLQIPFTTNRDLRKQIPEDAVEWDDLDEEAKKAVTELTSFSPTWLPTSASLTGIAKNLGYHAAGVVISNESLEDLVPLISMPTDENIAGVQYDMHDCEILGLLKLDMLGLRNIDIIQHTIDRVEKRHGTKVDIYNLPSDDTDTYELISGADYVSVFQLDSTGYRRLCRQLQPSRFEHIMALNALFRPGPLESGVTAQYVDRRHNKEPAVSWHPWLDDVLQDTYQTVLFQEQAMAMSRIIAGFSDVEADKFRKGIGKKKQEIVDACLKDFKSGAMKMEGLTPPPNWEGDLESWVDDLTEKLHGYARYMWNRGHSCLSGNSLVLTCNRGLVPIKHINRNEEVWSVREDTGNLFRNRVMDVTNNGIRDTVRLRVSDGRSIISTPDHRYFTSEHKYKYASELGFVDTLKMLNKRASYRNLNIPVTSIANGDEVPLVVSFDNCMRDDVMQCEAIIEPAKHTGISVPFYQFLSSVAVQTIRWVISGVLRPTFTSNEFEYTSGVDDNFVFGKSSRNSLLAPNTTIINLKNLSSYIRCDYIHPISRQSPFFKMSGKRCIATFERKLFNYFFTAISRIVQFSYQELVDIVRIMVPVAQDASMGLCCPSGYFDSGIAVNTSSNFGVCRRNALRTQSSYYSMIGNKDSGATGTKHFHFHDKIIYNGNVPVIYDNIYVESCIDNGPEEVWDLAMEQDPNYIANGFVVHNCGYGWITYVTAYLETHYAPEYYASLLDAYRGNNKRLPALLRSIIGGTKCKVFPPHINESSIDYDVGSDGNIYMGLTAIRNLGKSAPSIIEDRDQNGPYKSFIEFCQRMPKVNKTAKINLVKSGAFSWDNMLCDRDKVDNLDIIQKWTKKRTKKFDGSKVSPIEIAMKLEAINGHEYTDIEKTANERESLNSYITNHPAAIYHQLAPFLERGSTRVFLPSQVNAEECEIGECILLIGMVDYVHRKNTKPDESRGLVSRPYLNISLSDNQGFIITNIWWPLCEDLQKILVVGEIAMLECIIKPDKFRDDAVMLKIDNAINLSNGLPIQGVFRLNGYDPSEVVNKIGGMVNNVSIMGPKKYASIRGRISAPPDVLHTAIEELGDDIKFLIAMDSLE